MPPPFSLFSEELEVATLFSVSALLHQTRRSVGSWSHTHKTQQTTSEEPPQSLKDNSFILASFFLIQVSSREGERTSRVAGLCRQIRYDKFVHFIGNLPGRLQLLRVIVIIK